jgi:hypothetical protein
MEMERKITNNNFICDGSLDAISVVCFATETVRTITMTNKRRRRKRP